MVITQRKQWSWDSNYQQLYERDNEHEQRMHQSSLEHDVHRHRQDTFVKGLMSRQYTTPDPVSQIAETV